MPHSVRSVSAAIKLQRLVSENETLASELVLANKELSSENEVLASELAIANQRLAYQSEEMGKRADALVVANKELAFEDEEKEKRAAELVIANQELAFEDEEKGKRAAELVIANQELAFETDRGNRATDLAIANKRLASQNEEMGRRAAELVIANKGKIELLAQFLQSQKMESLGTLAGGVAHDMNNVLGAILGLATAHMEIHPAGSPTYRAFDTIYKAAVRGGSMVKCLLNFARQHPAEELQLDLNEILQEVARLLERTTLAKVRLVMDLTPDLRCILGDANALTHAFMNLCVNAVDAMPGNGTLTLRTRNIGSDWVEVVVEDTGSGMPKEVLERALDPFFTTKDVGKGTGLGLSMAHSTVLAHRGQMEIESELGQGTRVAMSFPVCESTAPPEKSTAEHRSAPPQRSLAFLLVDDDELIQSSTQNLLELLGHAVTGVLSGEEALVKLKAYPRPDAVILDINMPGLGGLGTLRRLRALCPALPVFISTGKVDQTALDVLAADPHCTLLTKPYTMRDLKDQIEALGQD